ncbi:hypothetical protein F511_34963 [Dorcoceras hygrometricum]|uniref:Uncharacterized protein n=1 Tax=Dorcoceras hygrometricum TaxID=472368 RepID=A0A2Z7CGR5_9LAMI|nr:hypothetical protein F511_34963 [Dorcoceras hygrometricum]
MRSECKLIRVLDVSWIQLGDVRAVCGIQIGCELDGRSDRGERCDGGARSVVRVRIWIWGFMRANPWIHGAGSVVHIGCELDGRSDRERDVMEFELKLLLVDIARSVRLNEEVTRVSQHFGVLTIISADDYLDSADTLVKERSADDYLDSADTLVKERSADDYLDSADTLVKERSADDYLDSADTLVKERSADDYLDSADTLVKERSADGLRAADRYDGVGVT